MADRERTTTTQQLLWSLDGQAGLLEEYVRAYKSEEEEYARKCALQEAEDLCKRQDAMDELRAALAQPGIQRLEEAFDACEEMGIPANDLADAEQELSARQQRHMEEARAAFRAEQAQEHEADESDEPIARDDETEMGERVAQQKKRKASKGGTRPVERRSLVQRLGLCSEISKPKAGATGLESDH